MARGDFSVSDAELALLRVIWESEPTTARDIRERLYPRDSASDRATVQKLLERLEAKKLIRRHRTGFAHTFTARLRQEELFGGLLRSCMSRFPGSTVAPVIMHLLETVRLTPQDRERIRAMLRERPSSGS